MRSLRTRARVRDSSSSFIEKKQAGQVPVASLSSSDITADRSANGERLLLEEMVKAIGSEEGFVVDIAASDGLSQSSTVGLFASPGWTGLAVEMDATKFAVLAGRYSAFPGAQLARTRVKPGNVVDIFRSFEVPGRFTALNLDIDSYDLRVLEAILEGGYRPSIVSLEINEKIPPGVFFSVEFDPMHYWQNDHFYGCSIDAAFEVARRYGYSLHAMEFNNAFFYSSEAAVAGFKDLSPRFAYEQGYKNAAERAYRFPYNSDVDHWMDLSAPEAVNQIESYFEKYCGLFSISESPAQEP